MVTRKRITPRKRRHIRLRKKIMGTAQRPRLNVQRSLKNLHVQLIDDMAHKVLVSASTSEKAFKGKIPYGGNVKAADALAEEFAKRAKEKGVKKIVFDRGGYDFHGRIKTLAESLRKQGLEF